MDSLEGVPTSPMTTLPVRNRDALVADLESAREFARAVCGVADAELMGASQLVRACYNHGFDEGLCK